jgi:hypothetical protein
MNRQKPSDRSGESGRPLTPGAASVHLEGRMADKALPYEIEFYVDDEGREPALAFLRGLDPAKRRAIGVAMTEVLQHLGPDVAKTSYGKTLGEGLFEFRLAEDAEQILRKAGKEARPETDEVKILLRVFFHPHGNKLLLLLSGYDKAEHDGATYQNEEIQKARKLLANWKKSKT